MQSIPKKVRSAGRKNAQTPINRSDLPPVRAKGQSVGPPANSRIQAIVVRLPQPEASGAFSEPLNPLPNRAFSPAAIKWLTMGRPGLPSRESDCIGHDLLRLDVHFYEPLLEPPDVQAGLRKMHQARWLSV